MHLQSYLHTRTDLCGWVPAQVHPLVLQSRKRVSMPHWALYPAGWTQQTQHPVCSRVFNLHWSYTHCRWGVSERFSWLCLCFVPLYVLFMTINMTPFVHEHRQRVGMNAWMRLQASVIIHAGVKYMLHTCLSVCDTPTGLSEVLTVFRFLRCPVAV